MIDTRDLTKRFGDFTALDQCSLHVADGEVFGLLGPNGAGKSTLIRLLLGFLRASSGTASICGRDCYRERVEVHRMLSYLPGDARLFRSLNGRQVLRLFSQVRGDFPFERALKIAERLDLNLNRWVGFMSTGMRQKLALTVALSVRQPLLILDEPTANLDPTVRSEVLQEVAEAKAEGRTVLFSSHVLSEIEEVCDRVVILRRGHLVHEQCMNQLKRRYVIVIENAGPGLSKTGSENQPPSELFESRRANSGKSWLVTKAPLADCLQWLVQHGFAIHHVQSEGLRAIYEQFHGSAEDEA